MMSAATTAAAMPPAAQSPTATRSRVHRVVAVTVLTGAIAVAVVASVHWAYQPRVHAVPTWAAVLLVASCLGELAYVRMRHGASAEDLTFYEAVVVAGVLLLPPWLALVVPLAALVLASAVMRRQPLKTLFNLGTYAASTSAMVAIYSAIGGARGVFSVASVVGAVVATFAFAAVNLLALSAVLSASEGGSVRAVLRDEWRLSAFMALGNVALGAVAVALAMDTPVLLAFAALPALTLGYAYRAAANGADERERASHLLALTGVLAGGLTTEELIREVATVVCRAFNASSVRVLVPDCSWVVAVPDGAASMVGTIEAVDADAGEGVGVVQLQLALGARSGDRGSRPWATKQARLGDGERVLLASITRMLASALSRGLQAAALREQTAQLASVVDNATDGIVVLDGDGQVVLWSPAMELMTGREAAAVVGTRSVRREPLGALAEVLGASAIEALPPVDLTKALRPDRPRGAALLTVHRCDDDERQLRASIAALFDPDGTLHKVVTLVHDVTADERLARLKSDFVATVSHELRTPITPIKGYARLLATRGESMDAEQRTRALRVIEDRADHLAKLVDDLLLASNISRDGLGGVHLELGNHDLAALARSAVAGLPSLSARTRFESPNSPLIAQCDPTRFNQCLTNILTNAQKYSEPGTAIEVRLGTESGVVTVSVADNGRGIPAEELDRIFDRFHRVEDSMTMTTAGSGLGLFITRELTRAMGGEVTVTSELGAGSCFTMRLPVAAPAVTAA